jgi:hypothetical protein
MAKFVISTAASEAKSFALNPLMTAVPGAESALLAQAYRRDSAASVFRAMSAIMN